MALPYLHWCLELYCFSDTLLAFYTQLCFYFALQLL